MPRSLALGFACAAALLYHTAWQPEGTAAFAQANRSYPTPAECSRGVAEALGKNTAFINTCNANERMCLNASSTVGRRTGHYLPNTPSCIPRTPEEIAAEKAKALKKAQFEAEVRSEMTRLGAHREKEIRQRLELRDRAQTAMPKPPPPQCTTEIVSATPVWQQKTQAAAIAAGKANIGRSCGSARLLSHSGLSCAQDAAVTLKKPPVGSCLACISEKQAIALGYVPGKGWPKPLATWTCRTTAKCERERCTGAPASATRQ